MTWKRLAALLAGVALATACALPGLPSAPRSAAATNLLPGEHCADLLAAALASPSVSVVGAFACQGPDLIANAQSNGIKTDADIESVAASLGFSAESDIGGSSGVFTYLMSGSGGEEVLIIYTDSNQLVAQFQRVPHP